MLGSSLQLIADYLNSRITQRIGTPAGQQYVILSTLFNPNQGMAPSKENVLVLVPVNIQRETTIVSQAPTKGGALEKNRPPLYLQVQFVLAAYYQAAQTQEGLNVLTMALQALHDRPVWNKQNTPDLPDQVGTMNTELYTMTFEQINHLWGSLGGRQLPSAVYRMRISFTDDEAVVLPNVTAPVIE